MNELRILRMAGVISRTGLSRSTIYLLIGQGGFPAPIKLGKRAVGWTSVSIDQWIEQCVENSK
jgi:prophage regulatory protein